LETGGVASKLFSFKFLHPGLRLSGKQYLRVVLGLAFILRLLWIILYNVRQTSDYGWYLDRALSISAGDGYILNGAPTAYWPIGYPAFLGAVFFILGNSLFLAKLLNVILATVTIYFVYKITQWITKSEEVSRITALLLAIYPNQIAYCSIFASEIPFVFFLTLAIYFLLVKNERGLLQFSISGLFFAMAIMIKPIVLFFPLLLIVLYKLGRNKFAVLFVIYVPVVILMSLWTYRNYTIFHEVFFSSSNVGVNLMIGNSPYADGTYIYDENTRALIGSPNDDFIEGKLSQKYAVEYIMQHPIKTVAMMPLKIWYIFVQDFDGAAANFHGINKKILYVALPLKFYGIMSQGFYMIIMFLSFYGMWIERKRIFKEYKFAAIFIIYFILMYMPFFGIDRFHYPMMAYFMIFSSLAIWNLMRKFLPQENS
jgi:hypothetical protein